MYCVVMVPSSAVVVYIAGEPPVTAAGRGRVHRVHGSTSRRLVVHLCVSVKCWGFPSFGRRHRACSRELAPAPWAELVLILGLAGARELAESFGGLRRLNGKP